MTKYLEMNLETEKHTSRDEVIKRTITASLNNEVTFKSVDGFSKSLKKIYKEAMRMYKEGDNFFIQLSSFDYEHNEYFSWTSTAEDASEDGLYFRPQTGAPYHTPERFDIFVTSDVLGSLADAGI